MKNFASCYSNYIVIMTFGVHLEKNWRKIQSRMYLLNGFAIVLREIGRNGIISISSCPLAMQW